MPAPLTIEVSAKDIAKAKRTLDKYRGRSLANRMERGTLQAARLLVNPIRSQAPQRTGATKRSVAARQMRLTGILRGAKVGPKVRYTAPLIHGHHLVAWGHDTDVQVPGNPFVQVAIARSEDDAIRVASSIIFERLP